MIEIGHQRSQLYDQGKGPFLKTIYKVIGSRTGVFYIALSYTAHLAVIRFF